MLYGFGRGFDDYKKDDEVKKTQRVIKTILDRLIAFTAIIVLSPILLIAAIGIRISSKGPIIYKASRMGINMKPITVFKFRTMRVGADLEGAITEANDDRVFYWGELLRKTKVDELPQLFNILNGTMSIIGPRPENIDIVEEYYSDQEKRTVLVLPGLACPGSIYNYTHGEKYLIGEMAQRIYVTQLVHVKLALDLYYLDHWSLLYDVALVVRTIKVIIFNMCGIEIKEYPYEYTKVYGSKDIMAENH